MNLQHDEYTADELRDLIEALDDAGWHIEDDFIVSGKPGTLEIDVTLVKHATND